MASSVRTDMIVPEILEEAVQGAFTSGMKALYGSPAAIVNGSLPGDKRGGDTVKIPYFGSLGELEDVAEGVALTPVALSMTDEEAAVQRAGKAFSMSNWAQIAAAYADPYKEAARQIVEGVARRADKALLDVAVAALAPMTLDEYDAGTPVTLNYDQLIEGKMLFGDEQDDIALLAVHSKTYGDLLKIKDSTGRPLLTDPVAGGLQRFGNIPIIVSDRVAPDGSSPAKYTSLVLKRGSLVFWYNGTPSVKTDDDILTDETVAAIHVYFAAHRYTRLPGHAKGGVVILKHN